MLPALKTGETEHGCRVLPVCLGMNPPGEAGVSCYSPPTLIQTFSEVRHKHGHRHHHRSRDDDRDSEAEPALPDCTYHAKTDKITNGPKAVNCIKKARKPLCANNQLPDVDPKCRVLPECDTDKADNDGYIAGTTCYLVSSLA